MNDSHATSLVKSSKDNFRLGPEIINTSCAYRPTSIDVDRQHYTSLSTSLSSFHNTSSPISSNRNTQTFQSRESIGEDKTPYDTARNFIMNPLAPAFVPRQEGQLVQGSQPAQGGQPSQGGQLGMLSLSLEHCRGTVSDPFYSNDRPQPVRPGAS